MTRLDLLLTLPAAVAVFALALPSSHPSAAQAGAALPRVYVHAASTDDARLARELDASVQDVRDALAKKKKDLALVDAADTADDEVEILERTTSIPRVRIGLAPPGAPGPARAVHLRVKLTHGEDTHEFTNRNTAYEMTGGWTTAAEDVAKQIDQWIVLHKGRG